MQKTKSIIADDVVKQLAKQEQQHNLLKGSNKQNSADMSAIRLDQYATAMIPINSIPRSDTGNISEDATNELLTTFQTRCDMTKVKLTCSKETVYFLQTSMTYHQAILPRPTSWICLLSWISNPKLV